MNVNALNTLSIIELLWIIITLVGLVVSGANLIDASDSSEVASKSQAKEPGEMVLKAIKVAIAAEHVRAEGIYLATHTLFFVIGFVAALAPPSPRPEGLAMSAPMIVAAVVVPVAFFAVQIAMIVNSLRVRKTRKYIVGLRVQATQSTESKGTFSYEDSDGSSEGTGAFSMKTEATRDSSNRRKDDPPAAPEIEEEVPPPTSDPSG